MASPEFPWDYRNRLLEAEEKQSGDWATVGEYWYDAQGRRIRKVVTNKGALNGTTRFVWGGHSHWQCLEEKSGDDGLVARFTYAPGYIDAVAVQERDLNADDDFGDTSEVVYYEQNTLFSVYALSDADGSVIERYRFDAYGGATVLDADGSADGDGLSDVRNPYVFTGRRLDPETGLMQYRHRYYSTGLGRFANREHEEYASTEGLYVYVRGCPTGCVDPQGNLVVPAMVIAIAIPVASTGNAVRKSIVALKYCQYCGECIARRELTIATAARKLPPDEFIKWLANSGILHICDDLCRNCDGRARNADFWIYISLVVAIIPVRALIAEAQAPIPPAALPPEDLTARVVKKVIVEKVPEVLTHVH